MLRGALKSHRQVQKSGVKPAIEEGCLVQKGKGIDGPSCEAHGPILKWSIGDEHSGYS